MSSYLDLLPKPKASTVNIGLASPKLSTLRSILGEPRDSYTGDCQPITGPFKDRVVTKSVGPFRCTGIDVAIDALKDVLDTVKEELPDLYAILDTAGMACARRVRLRQPNGTIKLGKNPSNHSWGLAVDIKLNGSLDRQGDDMCFRGLLVLSRYFNAAGWYWVSVSPRKTLCISKWRKGRFAGGKRMILYRSAIFRRSF